MINTWKGWMRPMDKWGPEGDDDRIGVNRPVKDRREANYTTPVLLTPIHDESLPYPLDRRDWELTGGAPVTVVAVDGDAVWVRYRDGRHGTHSVSDLREHKTEPEHEEWCEIRIDHDEMSLRKPTCTCERRSGQERRKGERRVGTSIHAMTGGRRRSWSPAINKGALHSNALVRGRRSGIDRRRS